MRARSSSLFCAVLLAAVSGAEAAGKLDPPTTNRVRSAIDVALTPLRFSQSRADGSYGDELTTALAVRAFMESHRRYTEEDGPFITKALDFLSRENEEPARWVARLAFSRSSKKPDPARWPAELLLALGPPSKLPDPSALAFAVEAVFGSGAPLDDRFWKAVAPAGAESAASDYVLALAALPALPGLPEKTGRADRETLARSVASRCARIGGGPARYHDYYFLAATLEAAAEGPPDCAGALAQELLGRQAFDGFWPPVPEDGGDKRRTTALAVLALAKLVEIE